MIIDTHCHLDQISNEILLSDMNVDNRYISMGTSSANWNQLLQLANTYSNIIPALGLHPWFVDINFDIELQKLQSLIPLNSIHVLGEIGLDFSSHYLPSKNYQLLAFEQQLSLAEQFNLPISVHVYKAHNELITLLKKYSVKGVIHSLGSSIQIAKQYLDLGYKFGVNGVIVRSNARRYHDLVKTFGVQSIVLETDCPNILLPNHSEASLIDIYTVVSKIAELAGLPESEVIQVTTDNAHSIFSLRNEFESSI